MDAWSSAWCAVVAALAAALAAQYAVYVRQGWRFEALDVIPPHTVRRMALVAAVPACIMIVGMPFTVYHAEARACGPLASVFFALELAYLPASSLGSVPAVAAVLAAAAAAFTAFLAVAAAETPLVLVLYGLPLANVWLNDCAYYVYSYARHKRTHSTAPSLSVLLQP